MKVRSPLANMDVSIGEIRRDGHELKLKAGPGSSIDADITVSAGEVLAILAKILTSGAGLAFVLGLPWFWLREKLGPSGRAQAASGSADRGPTADRPRAAAECGSPRTDINKPW